MMRAMRLGLLLTQYYCELAVIDAIPFRAARREHTAVTHESLLVAVRERPRDSPTMHRQDASNDF